jgi:DTW domain-containing protein YfiP
MFSNAEGTLFTNLPTISATAPTCSQKALLQSLQHEKARCTLEVATHTHTELGGHIKQHGCLVMLNFCGTPKHGHGN